MTFLFLRALGALNFKSLTTASANQSPSSLTYWKKRHDVNNLMLAIATQRFRIPLMWTVLGEAGSSNQCECIALMRRYLALLGSGSIAWLLADREFIGGQWGGRWIKFLLENNILFAIRVKENSIIRLQDGRGYQLKTLLRKPVGFKLLQSRPARLEAMDESLGAPLSFAAKRLGEAAQHMTDDDVQAAMRAGSTHSSTPAIR